MERKRKEKLRGFAELVISSYYFNIVSRVSCVCVLTWSIWILCGCFFVRRNYLSVCVHYSFSYIWRIILVFTRCNHLIRYPLSMPHGYFFIYANLAIWKLEIQCDCMFRPSCRTTSVVCVKKSFWPSEVFKCAYIRLVDTDPHPPWRLDYFVYFALLYQYSNTTDDNEAGDTELQRWSGPLARPQQRLQII